MGSHLLPIPELRKIARHNLTLGDAEVLVAQREAHLAEAGPLVERYRDDPTRLTADEARLAVKITDALRVIEDGLEYAEARGHTTILARRAAERREAECAEIRVRDGFDNHRQAQPAANDFGRRLLDAIGEVRDGKSVAYVPFEARAVEEGGAFGGGVPIVIGSPVMTLRAKSIVLGLPGIRQVPMTSDRHRFPRIGAQDAVGTPESTALSEDDPDLDLVDMVAQKFGVITYLSTEVEEDFTVDALQLLGENQLEALARKVDAGLLQGTGAGPDVVGIRNIASVNSTSVAATPADFDDFSDAIYEAEADNANPNVWVMHPRTWNTLSKVKTGISGDVTTLLEPSPQNAPRTLLGLPVATSTQITLTEGGSSNGSWVAALDTSQLLVGIRRPARVEVSRDLRFDRDQIAIRATTRVGFVALNPEGISLLTDIRA